MKKEIEIKKGKSTDSHIAFIDKDGEPVKYGTLVSFETNENSLYGKRQWDLYLTWYFTNGKLGFVSVDELLQCGKIRLIEAEAVNFSEIYFYYTKEARELERKIVSILEIDYQVFKPITSSQKKE